MGYRPEPVQNKLKVFLIKLIKKMAFGLLSSVLLSILILIVMHFIFPNVYNVQNFSKVAETFTELNRLKAQQLEIQNMNLSDEDELTALEHKQREIERMAAGLLGNMGQSQKDTGLKKDQAKDKSVDEINSAYIEVTQ